MNENEKKLSVAEQLALIRKTSTSPLELQMSLIGMLCETVSECSQVFRETLEVRDIYCEDIRAFHEKFDLKYDDGPRKLDVDMQKFRIKFLKEELTEYECAVATGNMEKQFDALIDLVYVALGTAYLHGFPFRKGWNRVQRANMAKILAQSAADSTRGYSKDVVKPKGWKAPDLTDLVNPL